MKNNDREIIESPLYQGVNESIAYTLDTTPWGGAPGNASVTLLDEANGDVSVDHLSGSVQVADNLIITPAVHTLAVGVRYRLQITWETAGGNIQEAYGIIHGQR